MFTGERARSFYGGPSEFRVEELHSHLDFLRELYENADSCLRERTLKLQRVREMLTEQHRRVELKSASREAGSAAGLLYRQQLEFIERVLRATEG